MPYMIDDNGLAVYAAQPTGEVIVTPLAADSGVGASALIVATATVDTASTTAVAVTSTFGSIVAGATMTAGGRTKEEIIKDQQATQAGLDNSTPRNLFIVFGGVLVVLMILSHPRFLARLFASNTRPRRQRQRQRHTTFDTKGAYPFDPSLVSPISPRDERERPVGGGDLRQGWILQAGSETSTNDTLSTKSDPFASPFDDHFDSPIPSQTYSPPPHIIPLLHHLPFSSKLLFAPFARFPQPFASAVNLSQLYLILGYLIIIAFALVWRSDITPTTASKGYGGDFMRTGLVAIAHLPIVVALGVRGNIIGLCIGKGYEKLKVFHKLAGRVLFLAATLHVAFYFHKFAKAGIFGKMLSKPFIIAGLIAWVAIVVIAFTSIPFFRGAFYGVFKVCHVIGIIGLLTGMCFHVDVAVPWCISALVIYILSIVCSLTKTRLASAEFAALPGSNTTVITIPGLRTGWRAGQHVRIRVPALGLAHGHGLQGHPFTIASAPNGEGMILMCKVAGDWTQKLYDFASNSDGHHASPSISSREKEQFTSSTATVILEGPYGGLGNTLLPSFSGVMLVAGGSGITHALAIAHDLITRAPSGVVRSRIIDLIWTVRTEDAARPLMPTLLDLVEDARRWEERCLEGRMAGEDLAAPVALRVHLHVTRCPNSSPLTLLSPISPSPSYSTVDMVKNPFESKHDYDHDDVLEDRRGLRRQPSAAEREKAAYLARTRVTTVPVPSPVSPSKMCTGSGNGNRVMSGIVVEKSRPDFPYILDGIMDEVLDKAQKGRTNPCGVCVTACGPSGLVDSVRDAVRNLEGWKRRAVGDVELEEERFGL